MTARFELDCDELARVLRTDTVCHGADVLGPSIESITGSSIDKYRKTSSGLVLYTYNLNVNQPVSLTRARRNWIHIHFIVSGSYLSRIDVSTSRAMAGTIRIVADARSTTTVSPSPRPVIGTCVYVERQQLVDVFGLQVDHIPELYRSIFTSGSGGILSLELAMPPSAWAAAQEVVQCRFAGPLRAEYLNAKAIELTCYAVAELNKLRPDVSRLGVSRAARERAGIRMAENIYRHEISNPPELDEVARRVGLGRNKLVGGFRERFSMTPADYSRSIRLARAHEMLLSRTLPVERIAWACGYTSHAAFSRSFRQYYGYPPSQARSPGEGPT